MGKMILEELVGHKIQVRSVYGNSEYSDDGILEGFDGVCLRLRKHMGDVLIFPIANIRLIKLFDVADE